MISYYYIFFHLFSWRVKELHPPRGADQLADASAALARRSRHVPTPHRAAVALPLRATLGDQPTGEFTFSKCHGFVVNTIVIEWDINVIYI